MSDKRIEKTRCWTTYDEWETTVYTHIKLVVSHTSADCRIIEKRSERVEVGVSKMMVGVIEVPILVDFVCRIGRRGTEVDVGRHSQRRRGQKAESVERSGFAQRERERQWEWEGRKIYKS